MLVIVIFVIFFKYQSSPNVKYKKRWGINIPNTDKINDVIYYSGGGDYEWLSIYDYNLADIEIIKKNETFKKVDKEMLEIYGNIVNQCFIMYLDEENKKIFDSNFNTDDLFVESNYYAFFDLQDEYRYYFEFLLLDTKNNQLYSIASDYGFYGS